jgi:hypothetical protein
MQAVLSWRWTALSESLQDLVQLPPPKIDEIAVVGRVRWALYGMCTQRLFHISRVPGSEKATFFQFHMSFNNATHLQYL